MKLEKFMCEVTKALVKDKRVMFWEYGDKVVISNDGYFAIEFYGEQGTAIFVSENGGETPCGIIMPIKG